MALIVFEITSSLLSFLGCHVIYVGSILSVKPIELKKDIENLFDVYGDIKETYYADNFAKLHIECDRETGNSISITFCFHVCFILS